MTANPLRVYIPGADWLAQRWARYLEGAAARRRRLESEAAALRFESWLDTQFCAGRDLTEALREADQAVRLDCLRGSRHQIVMGNRYITAFGEIDIDRAFN